MDKFFTVIVPVYNPTKLERALDSIESQGNKDDIEVIIVDDCSTNKDYQKILSKYTFNYNLIENNKNLGCGLTRQVGLDNATGKWITFLDHDDEFSPDCFTYIKEFIETNGCEFVLVTNTIVADNYDWMTTNQYRVDNTDNHFHGKLYNLEKLKEYDIHFSKKLIFQEDTYFISLLEGNIILSGLAENTKTKMYYDLVTYYWYLWKDSTSHERDEKDTSYFEKNFEQYILANFMSCKKCSMKYNLEEKHPFIYLKYISLLFYCYWFYEYFMYSNPDNFIKDNLLYIKNVRDLILEELNISNDDLVEFIIHSPDIYRMTSQGVSYNTSPFIPFHTIGDFYTFL